jgi:hypothetical protein
MCDVSLEASRHARICSRSVLNPSVDGETRERQLIDWSGLMTIVQVSRFDKRQETRRASGPAEPAGQVRSNRRSPASGHPRLAPSKAETVTTSCWPPPHHSPPLQRLRDLDARLGAHERHVKPRTGRLGIPAKIFFVGTALGSAHFRGRGGVFTGRNLMTSLQAARPSIKSIRENMSRWTGSSGLEEHDPAGLVC